MLLQEGLCGNDAASWDHVILAITKCDAAADYQIKRWERTLVNKFYEDAPTECKRHYCFTRANGLDESGNATSVDVSSLLDKLGDLPDQEDFFFAHRGVSR